MLIPSVRKALIILASIPILSIMITHKNGFVKQIVRIKTDLRRSYERNTPFMKISIPIPIRMIPPRIVAFELK